MEKNVKIYDSFSEELDALIDSMVYVVYSKIKGSNRKVGKECEFDGVEVNSINEFYPMDAVYIDNSDNVMFTNYNCVGDILPSNSKNLHELSPNYLATLADHIEEIVSDNPDKSLIYAYDRTEDNYSEESES